MDIVFAWDNTDSGTPRPHDRDDDGYRGRGGNRGRGGGGGRGRGRGRAYDDETERRNSPGDYQRGRGGRYDDDSGSRGLSRGGSFSERYDNPSRGSYNDGGYGGPSGYGGPGYGGPAVPGYGQPPAATGPVSVSFLLICPTDVLVARRRSYGASQKSAAGVQLGLHLFSSDYSSYWLH